MSAPHSTEARFAKILAKIDLEQHRAAELTRRERAAQSETRSIPQRPAGTPNVRRIQRAVRSVSPGPGRGSLPD